MKYLIVLLFLIFLSHIQAQTNNFPLYSSGTYTLGVLSDATDVSNAHLKLQSSSGYIRVAHLSAHPSISAVYNFETGKSAYWGEPLDAGQYLFRGRDLIVQNGKTGIGTVNPMARLHVKNGALMAGDVSYDNINARLEGTSIPSLRFTRWIGSGTTQHNAFVGQFMNTSAGNEYSLTIGMGVSNSGDQNLNTSVMTFLTNGNVGIGTTNPGTYKLAVEGKIGAREINVTVANPWPDYVFETSYTLPSLDSVQSYINQNKHLPEVPSAKEMETNGVNLGEMNMLLLKKVEELTLYVLEQQREIKDLKTEVRILKSASK